MLTHVLGTNRLRGDRVHKSNCSWIRFLFRDRAAVPAPGKFDKHFLAWLWNPVKKPPILSELWFETLHGVTIFLSDQFIVTGIALLVTGYSQTCKVSIYHFEIITWLVWITSTSHQLSLTTMRDYLRKHSRVLYLRVVGMTIMFIMLFVALALAGATLSPDPAYAFKDLVSRGECHCTLALDAPARYTWNRSQLRTWAPDVVFSVCVLTFGFVSRLVKLFEYPSKKCKSWLSDIPGDWLKVHGNACLQKALPPCNWVMRVWWKSWLTVLIIIYVWAKGAYECLRSALAELFWISFSLAYGTTKVFSFRSYAADTAQGLQENDWTFGQVLALFMLIIPLFAVIELYSGKPSLLSPNRLS